MIQPISDNLGAYTGHLVEMQKFIKWKIIIDLLFPSGRDGGLNNTKNVIENQLRENRGEIK